MMRTMIWLVLGVVGCGLLALFGWRVWEVATQEAPVAGGRGGRGGGQAVGVRAEGVTRRTMRDVRTFTGSLRPASMFVVAPKVGGQLLEVRGQIGDRVGNGDLIARIEDAEYRLQVEQAEAENVVALARIEQCKARVRLAEREFRRAAELRERQVISQAEYEQSEAAYLAIQEELKVLQAQALERATALRAARVRLGYTQIHATWENGTAERYVGARYVDEGEMLGANTPILRIVDIDTLEAVAHVIERDYPLLRVGQGTRVRTDAYPERTFAGTISRISPMLREQSRQAEMRVLLENPDHLLRPGMFVRVEVELEERVDVPVVPRTAVVTREGVSGVWRIDEAEGTVSFHPVTVGLQDRVWVELREGAFEGRVATLGNHLLREGARVTVSNGDDRRGGAGAGRGEGRAANGAASGTIPMDREGVADTPADALEVEATPLEDTAPGNAEPHDADPAPKQTQDGTEEGGASEDWAPAHNGGNGQ